MADFLNRNQSLFFVLKNYKKNICYGKNIIFAAVLMTVCCVFTYGDGVHGDVRIVQERR